MRFHHILAVLDGPAGEQAAVLERAAGLAEREHGRLTLTALAHPGWASSWLSPLALSAPAQPLSQEELDERAAHRLAAAAEHVPGCVPLTTFAVREPPRRAVQRLAACGDYDLIVVGAHLGGREGTAQRCLRGLGVSVLVVAGDEAPAPAPAGG